MDAETLLYGVRDRKTFVEFVEVLSMESGMIYRDCMDAVIGGVYLRGGLAFLEGEKSPQPSWRMFADFLYFGKFYGVDKKEIGERCTQLAIDRHFPGSDKTLL